MPLPDMRPENTDSSGMRFFSPGYRMSAYEKTQCQVTPISPPLPLTLALQVLLRDSGGLVSEKDRTITSKRLCRLSPTPQEASPSFHFLRVAG